METDEILVMQIRDCCMKIQKKRAGITHLEKEISMDRGRVIMLVVLLLLLNPWWVLMDIMVIIIGYILIFCLSIIPFTVKLIHIFKKTKRLKQQRIELTLHEAHLNNLLEQLPKEQYFKVTDALELTVNLHLQP
ncbi:MAG: hypothetical protein PUC12_12260 [Clostridiales bacterium]|nr:hypothetical protein [Clostridiales bacterium]